MATSRSGAGREMRTESGTTSADTGCDNTGAGWVSTSCALERAHATI